jgi:subtilase family serine protease
MPVPVLIRRLLGVASVLVLGVLLMLPGLAMAQAKPDLVVTALDPAPVTALPGESFTVNTTVRNQGTVGGGASLTKFFLVSTTGPIKKNLKGTQNVPALAASATESTPVTVAVFSDTVPGTYQLQACADGGGIVPEAVETNNCRTATGTITVEDIPDLRVTAITNPPASVGMGQTFKVTTTVQNFGPVTSPATSTRYYLVTLVGGGAPATDNCLSGGAFCKKLKVSPASAVPGLAPVNGTFTHEDSLRADPEITPLGSYRVQACADGAKTALEDNETNNCRTSTTAVQVTPVPDLTVSAVTVTAPALPATVTAGAPDATVSIEATVSNLGTALAAASTMKFVLVKTGPCTPGNGCTKNLKGTAAVPQVAASGNAPVTATVSVYEDTPSGTYNVQACVDSLKVVGETAEGNNCTTAAGVLTVNGVALSTADLVVTALGNPPATGVAGATFNITASVRNDGSGPAPATQTKFYLFGGPGGTTRKNLKGVQAVPGLTAGASASPVAALKIFDDTIPGTYVLEACADGPELLAEIDENNNCSRSTGEIVVQEVPNLVVTFVSEPPATVGQGFKFNVTSTVKNEGPVPAKASVVKFNLVSTTGVRKDLKNRLAVIALNPTLDFTDELTVQVRAETVPGSYRLEACADSTKTNPEQNEDDNCKLSAGSVTITPVPDLAVSSVTVPAGTPSIKRGTTFVVTSVVKNLGLGNSAGISTTTQFKLVKVNAAAVTRNLTPTQAVPALPAGASSASLQTTVTIPASTQPGQYQVQACADSGKALTESQEGNNCATSVGKITVTQ